MGIVSLSVANVTIKDSIFQPSYPIRHTAELLAISKRLNTIPDAFTLAFTDEYHDHDISFLHVMVSLLVYLILSRCDSLVDGRTTPTQSWTNLDEHVMPVLNLALFSCALARDRMGDELGRNMKKYNNMASVRKMAEQLYPGLVVYVNTIVAIDIVAPIVAKTSTDNVSNVREGITSVVINVNKIPGAHM